MIAVRGRFFASSSVAINTNALHRAKGFGGHQDALAIEILDLDAPVLVDFRWLGGWSWIHGTIAVQGSHHSRQDGTGACQVFEERERHTLEGHDAVEALCEN